MRLTDHTMEMSWSLLLITAMGDTERDRDRDRETELVTKIVKNVFKRPIFSRSNSPQSRASILVIQNPEGFGKS